mmetsp:Transcript_70246/g.206009  ORF Transcript_70246/g.206009 Transcript_70246/m.206009 type:complete len:312 (-) Transcript_70246:37-972(-)
MPRVLSLLDALQLRRYPEVLALLLAAPPEQVQRVSADAHHSDGSLRRGRERVARGARHPEGDDVVGHELEGHAAARAPDEAIEAVHRLDGLRGRGELSWLHQQHLWVPARIQRGGPGVPFLVLVVQLLEQRLRDDLRFLVGLVHPVHLFLLGHLHLRLQEGAHDVPEAVPVGVVVERPRLFTVHPLVAEIEAHWPDMDPRLDCDGEVLIHGHPAVPSRQLQGAREVPLVLPLARLLVVSERGTGGADEAAIEPGLQADRRFVLAEQVEPLRVVLGDRGVPLRRQLEGLLDCQRLVLAAAFPRRHAAKVRVA